MTQFVLRISVLVLAFVIGIFATSLVNQAAYYYIPDVDAQPRVPTLLGIKACG
jgi:hypothetical protein